MHLNCYLILLENCDVTPGQLEEALRAKIAWGKNVSIGYSTSTPNSLEVKTASRDIFEELDERLRQYLHIRAAGTSHDFFMRNYR